MDIRNIKIVSKAIKIINYAIIPITVSYQMNRERDRTIMAWTKLVAHIKTYRKADKVFDDMSWTRNCE